MNANIKFEYKLNGEQMVPVAIIHTEEETIKFYIKTHRNGIRTQCSREAEVVNSCELFVYKLLEKLNIGPKARLYFSSERDFYIVTQDAGYDNDLKKNFNFISYDNLKKSGTTIGKSLSEIELLAQGDRDENSISLEARNILHQLTKLDLICRIFSLSGVSTDQTNFGFL
jgi:hypothetical protein